MEDKSKKTIIILVMFTIIFTVIGSSLAYLNWQSSEEQKTMVTFTATTDFTCAADGGGNITSSDVSLAPTTCTDTNRVIKRTIKVTPTISMSGKSIYMDLWLDVNNMGTGLSDSQNFKYAITTGSSSCSDGMVSSGNFNGTTSGDKVFLLNSKDYSSSTTDTYYLWIWLDAAEESTATMNQTFDLSLNGNCSDISVASVPVIDNTGMIPVAISNNGLVTTVSEDNNAWYNYNNQRWANIVLVDEEKRSNYLNTDGVVVDENDILAYYVWIPRYSYQIWTTGTSSAGSEQTVNIKFENSDTTKSTGTEVGEYRTHPAFTFGSDELEGIWVGKYETTKGTSVNVGTTNPTILPNTTAWTSQNVSTQFQTALLFAGGLLTDGEVTFNGSSTYGLAKTTDSHMMKNSEWGAVAYLSHSIYGINGEIYINNSGQKYTGRSGGNVGGSVAVLATHFNDSSLSTSNQYNNYGYYTWTGRAVGSTGTIGDYASDRTLGTNASTTGNVTGVYDMSGGAWEYVMGVFANSAGDLYSGNSTTYNSGFNGILYDSGNNSEYLEGISFPTNSKYYDKYQATTGTTISKTTACDGGICYGHGLSEVNGWYGDYANFVSSSYPWFNRGGVYDDGASAGAFYFNYNQGHAGGSDGFRSVLAPSGA